MQSRLKVADFYQPLNLACAIEIQNLQTAFFVQEWLFVTTKDAPTLLQQYSLISKLKVQEILLPHQGLAGVEVLGKTICFYFMRNEDLWIYSGDQVIALKSHFTPITALISHKGCLYSGSADMTIRIWNQKKETLTQDPKLHALSAHTGSVNRFLSLDQLLLSASADKSVIVWKGTNIHTKKVFTSEIVMMAECSQSRQLAFYQKEGNISIIDGFKLIKQKRIEIIRTIDQTFTQIVGLHEMDDSFLEIILPCQVSIAQINLGNVMAKLDLGEKIEIVRSRCLRRMTLLAVSMRGLYSVAF